MRMNTGLTDQEKESLIKSFLVSGELHYLENPTRLFSAEFIPYKGRIELDERACELISKAMRNLVETSGLF